ncbi:membrane protein [Staphylococcus aureus]|nr:membrane protein [Staphylococcus aureus]CAC7012658.1 membrane protein [Staphylococcus aureus]CAC7016267.1 membrane protein [Staphylococcus aureus]CAC7017095.1 membrane protein [Staphylococcus aureus]CAC7018130.1 membrane protein [Staphylococcus aureus]
MYFVLAIFTIISASVSLGYSIQACASSHNINAYYALSRSLPLIFSLVIHSAIFLITISIAMILVQFLDAIVGYKSKDGFKTYGPLATSVVNLILLIVFLF